MASFSVGEGHTATLLKRTACEALSPLQPMPTMEGIESWSVKNTSLMVQTFVLAATSHELATCMMEGYDSRRLKEILRVPDRYAVPMAVAVGYEYEEEGVRDETKEGVRSARLSAEEVFFGDVFGGELGRGDFQESD